MEWCTSSSERNCQLILLHSEKLYFIIEGEIKTFHEKQKLKEFMTIKAAVQKILKGILYTEEDKCNHENMEKNTSY
jgi:hypothetical protein